MLFGISMHRVRYFIGILTLIAAIAGAFWIVGLLQQLDDRPGVTVQIEFRNARGLRAGATVRYRGVIAGTVRAVEVAEDGNKAVVTALLDPSTAVHACQNSRFWIVTPRFGGLTGGNTGLDTLVRDAYLASTFRGDEFDDESPKKKKPARPSRRPVPRA